MGIYCTNCGRKIENPENWKIYCTACYRLKRNYNKNYGKTKEQAQAEEELTIWDL